ncbi:MAG: ParB/RepB/Spo0J family partition protein [Clostridia bacterium]|jgi:ParB family chromosome partitioning protein|nr:ParB/RepB/Spo0J family partition protein [Clostridia bacterium]MBQ6721059.1 ParB/RepB/Spo0J family partition protein [Clostridia bacterium]MBQ9401267.1 ParB/RepB/Spo0J family partition protein [Clostridia bacterium]
MAKKTHGLGRGLDSLFAGSEDWGTSIQEIPVGELDPNPDQPRRTFSEESIGQLADSIREQGVLQPLLVAPSGGGRYMIIAGERRFRAGRAAGLATLPCIVKDIDVIRQREIALIENLQREDLNPIEAARGVKALMDQCGYTQEKIGERLGKSRPAIANMIRLLQLPDEVSEMVKDGLLSAGHARVLIGIPDKETQLRLARKAVDEGLNVRQMEQLAKTTAGKPKKKAAPKQLPAELGELQDKIRRKTGLKSTLTGSIKKGRIVLQYSTREELEHLNDILDMLED